VDGKLVIDSTTAASTAVIALTGVVALIYARQQLKQARETEKVKHLVDFNWEFDSEPMTKWRRIVAEKRLGGVTFPDEALRLLDFFETIGLLVRRGYLDESDVWSTFSYWMFYIYADFRSDIEQIQRGDKNYYSDSCELLERLGEIEKEMGSSDDRPSQEEIRDFWEEEAKIVPGSPIKKRKWVKKDPSAE
jgi:hypothetical protein